MGLGISGQRAACPAERKPLVRLSLRNAVIIRGGFWTFSAYASDAWQANNRLTLTLGLRYDRYRLFLPAQSHSAGTRERAAVRGCLQPCRLELAHAAPCRRLRRDTRRQDARQIQLRTLPRRPERKPWPSTRIPTRTNGGASTDWADLNQNGRLGAGRGGTAPTPPRRRRHRIDGPRAETPAARRSRRVDRTVASRRHRSSNRRVWRLERFLFARQNVNQPFEAFTVPVSIRDRGPDGLAGTGDDGPIWTAYDLHPDYLGQPLVNEVRNVAGSSSEYLTLEIAATRPMRGRWTFGAGFAHTWNGDQASGYSGQSLRNNAYPLTPNDLLNAGAGGRYEFSTWTAKAHGTFEGAVAAAYHAGLASSIGSTVRAHADDGPRTTCAMAR